MRIVSLTRVCLTLLTTTLAAPSLAGAMEAKYLYGLASVGGATRIDAAQLSVDRHAKELFVVGDGVVRVFNATGLEVFSFEPEPSLGNVSSVVAVESGDLLVLSYVGDAWRLTRCDFRGRPRARIDVADLPPAFAASFRPNIVQYTGGKLFLASESDMKVAVVDPTGHVLAAHDLAELAGIADQRRDTGLNGFGVDEEGNVLFTVAPIFKVFVLSPTGELRSFGKSGGAPGRFNIVAGVASMGGHYFVADALKCAVIVFDAQFNFVSEFGFRGSRPSNLLNPGRVAASDGKLYVAQGGGKGVSVFAIAW